jgi:outer membrane lipoprotein carrier protein
MRFLKAALVLIAISNSCWAQESALLELQQRLDGIQSLSGNFRQQLIAPDGEQLEHSSGHFALLQPDYFSWQILLPDEQLLLAAQGMLWHYDVELETVTRRAIPANDPYSPLEILAGDSEALGQYYQVEPMGPDAWRLLPLVGSGDIVAIELTFDGQLPQLMAVLDPLERTTRIEFSDLVLNPALAAGDFSFEPPPGVDVYSND